MSGENRISRGGFTLVELLVVIAIIGALAGFLVPNIIRARTKAKQVECLNKVKGIGAMVLAYADETKSRGAFPFGAGKSPLAYESLQKMVDLFPGELKPAQFICPESYDIEADADDDAKFTLTEESCSYAYLASRKRNTAKGTVMILCDDSVQDQEAGIEENHEGGVNAYFADGQTVFVDKEDKFPDTDLPKGMVGNVN